MAAKKRPNILIVMTDHQRGDTALPEHPAKTPNLDRLVREGVAFTETYCPSPHCCPSRASFFSGLYPSQHGVWNNVANCTAIHTGLDDGVRLFSEDLAEAGYDLAFSGKWHVSAVEAPSDRGWRHIGQVTGVGLKSKEYDWNRCRELLGQDESAPRGYGQILRPGYDRYTLFSRRDKDDLDINVAEAGVAELHRLAGSTQPWAMYLGLHGPHDPYRVPGKFIDLYNLDEVPAPPSYPDDFKDKPRIYQRLQQQRFGMLSEREVRDGVRHFWAYCSYLDHLFGKVLAALERSGQAENTIVLYCSDHGDYCGDHGLFAKGVPSFRGAYHVPAIVRWPAGLTRPGRAGGRVRLAYGLRPDLHRGRRRHDTRGPLRRGQPHAVSGRAEAGRLARRHHHHAVRAGAVLHAARRIHQPVAVRVQRVRLRRAVRPLGRSARDA